MKKFKCATEIDTVLKRRFVSFKVTPSNEKVVCVYAPRGHNTRKQIAGGHFFEGVQHYSGNESDGNEKRII